MLQSLLSRLDGTPADAPYLRTACDQLLRAYVLDSGRDLAITGARIELPGNEPLIELIVRDVSPRAREGRTPRTTTAPSSALPSATRNVLVVDDDPVVLEIIRRQLDRMQWQVTPCRSALEALTHLGTHARDFDLLITDVRMPSIDGTELARRVRALVPSLPIVLMSGETAGLTRDLVLPGRAWHFLEKPFEPERLREVLDAAVSAAR